MQTGKKQKTSITADDIFKRKSVAPKKSENTGDSQDNKDDNNGQENDDGVPGGEGS